MVEDHGDVYTFDYLKEEGIPDEVLLALRLLTHPKDVDYLDYVRAIKKNPLARRVKLADLRHNSDASRLGGVLPKKYDLYLQAIAILEEEGE